MATILYTKRTTFSTCKFCSVLFATIYHESKLLDRIKNNVRNMWWNVEAYDRLCHKQDSPFSMSELHTWLATSGLHLVHLTDPTQRHLLSIDTQRDRGLEPCLVEKLKLLPVNEQREIAELIDGSVFTHKLFASKKARPQATPQEEEMEVRVFGSPDWRPEKFAWMAEHGPKLGGSLTKLSFNMGKVSHSVWLPLTKDVIHFLTLTRRGKLTVAEAIDRITMDSIEGDAKTRVMQEISAFFEAGQATDMFLLRRKGLLSLEASTADKPLFSLTLPRPKLRNPRLGLTVNDVLYPKP